MTTDTKVGLLLGLIFIIIIAFLINGLPGFLMSDSADALSTNLDNTIANKSVIIGPDPIKVPKHLGNIEAPPQQRNTVPPTDRGNIDLTNALVPPEVEKIEVHIAKSVPGIHTVKPSDSLGSIAIKFYGPELGNKEATVQKIYQANKNILTSPHRILPGQKLTMPLRNSLLEKEPTSTSTEMLEQFKNIINKTINKKEKASAEYVVKEGDNLWQVAAAYLGNGARFHEIIELNKDIIYDAEEISVGMRLKIPHR